MRRLILMVVLASAASACSTGSETTSSAAVPGSTGTTGSDATSSTVDATTESASCVGVWELDSEAFFEMYNELASAEDQISFVGGRYVVTWNGDGTFTDERVDWTFEFPGIDDAGAMIMQSTGAGEWQLVGAETVVTAYELIDPQVSMIIDGEEFELPVTPGSLPSGLFSDDPTVVCTETVMMTSQDGYESVLARTG